MNIIDYIIGITLMNAMPHFVLGTWKAKMLSGFGVGNRNNILWGLSNIAISISLFIYKYGIDGIRENKMYLGGLTVLLIYFLTSGLWYKYFKEYE